MATVFEGMSFEDFKIRFSGTLESTQDESAKMPLDRTVVMLVAARVDDSALKVLDEAGGLRLTRVLKVEHVLPLDGELRQQAMTMLAHGNSQGLLSLPNYVHGNGETPTPAPYARTDSAESGEHSTDSVEQTAPPVGVTADGEIEPEFFDVPVGNDDDDLEGPVGHVRDYSHDRSGERAPGTSSSDGPRVGKVDFDQLDGIRAGSETGSGSGSSGSGVVGERVGSIYPEGHKGRDKHLQAFMSGDPDAE